MNPESTHDDWEVPVPRWPAPLATAGILVASAVYTVVFTAISATETHVNGLYLSIIATLSFVGAITILFATWPKHETSTPFRIGLSITLVTMFLAAGAMMSLL